MCKFDSMLNLDLMKPLFTTLRDAAVLIVNKTYVQKQADGHGDEEFEEAALWDGILDSVGWVVKLYRDSIADLFHAEMLPFIQGLLSLSSCPAPLMSFALSTLLDVIECVPQLASPCTQVVAPLLFTAINDEEVAPICAYGFGVCAMHGGEAYDAFVANSTAFLLQAATMEPDEDDHMALQIRDNCISSMLKTAIFRGALLGPGKVGVCKHALENLPLGCDLFEARLLHKLIVDMCASHDPRLCSEEIDVLAPLLTLLTTLAAMDFSDNREEEQLESDYWETQPIFPSTLSTAQTVLQRWLSCVNPTGAESLPFSKETFEYMLLCQPVEIKHSLQALAGGKL
jgi:hypothetical protein